MDLTRPGLDQAEDPIKTHHPAVEEEHHENGASKMFKKVKASAKKFKDKYTKHGQGHENDHDVDEEDDENDELVPEKHDVPVNESSAVRSGVTSQPEFLSHAPETNVPAPEEIIPPGTKVAPVVSSDYTRPVEPKPLQETSYGYESPSYPVREAPSPPLRVSDLSDREEIREPHHEPMNTPASLLSTTEDETRTFAPGEDEYLGGQQKVNVESPKRLEKDPATPGEGLDYLSHVPEYKSKVTNPTQEGGGEAEITESLGRIKVTDESHDQKSELGFESDLPTKSQEFERESEFGIGKDSPAKVEGESGAELGKDIPTRSFEIDQKTESGSDNLPTGTGGKPETGLMEYFPAESNEFDQKIDSGIEEDTGFGGKPGTEKREDFLVKSHEFDQEIESGIAKDSPTGFGGESEVGLEKSFSGRSDDLKVEPKLGKDLQSETHDQFSPEDVLESQAEEKRDEEAKEPKPSTYTEKIGSATSFITDKGLTAKDAVASRLGYSGETPGTARGTIDDKLTPDEDEDKETRSTVSTEVPLSGGGSGAEETEQGEDKGVTTGDYLAKKVTAGEEDKALAEVISEKLNLGEDKKTTKEVEGTGEKIPSDEISEKTEHGEAVAEESKGGEGMVGKIKGVYNYWLGGEEVKPKSPVSVEESSQSLGSTVGTKGFPDSGESGLGETGGGGGAVPVQSGL